MVFPVYWMVSTAFKPGNEVLSYTPKWIPDPTLVNFRDAIGRPYFWDNVKNSLIVVCAVVAASVTLAFLAALALAKFRFRGRRAFVVIVFAVQMVPLDGADHPALHHAQPRPPGRQAHRRDRHLPRVRPSVLRLDAARVRRRRAEGARGGGDGRRLDPFRRLRADHAAARRARVSSRPRSSRSSRPGTSTSSPTSCSRARRSRR